MVSRERAIEIVEQHFALTAPGVGGSQRLVVGTEGHRLGWFVYAQTELFARTREFRYTVIGGAQ
jgi:hypothetical protein